MSRKPYTTPRVRPLDVSASDAVLVGSIWSEDGFSRRMEWDEEEDTGNGTGISKEDFWSF